MDYKVSDTDLTGIANKIRAKGGTTALLPFPTGYENAIDAIPTGITPTGTKNISTNGTHDVVGYASAAVNVPNSYSASDEGKVVDNGALAAQTTQNITENGTHDTTTNDEVVVNVPNTYSASDEGKVVQSGALVSQTSQNISENGTYDTTTKNEVVVNVSGGGSTDLADFIMDTLTSISDSTVTSVRRDAFRNAISLQNISLPNATSIGDCAFAGTKGLQSVSLPNATTITGGNNFEGSRIPILVLPKVTSIAGSYVFRSNTAMTAIDLAGISSIGAQWFAGNTQLTTIILRGTDGITALSGGTAVFNNTPFKSGGTGGTIYVPSALISTYQSATNWSTVNGYGTITWTAIEGSQYENYYADGTPITT